MAHLIPMDADILPPTDDLIFKCLLTHPDAGKILIDIISTVIERNVTSVQIRNVELVVTDTKEKAERFDVNCTIDNKDQINVEMHCETIPEKEGIVRVNFINKYVYYLNDLHSMQTAKGIAYYELARTYQITFSLETVFPKRKGFVHKFTLRAEDGEQLTDQINMVIIELEKMNYFLEKPVEEMTSFEKWLFFLRFAPDRLQREKINAIIREKEEISMASELLQAISQDEAQRAHFRSRRMYQSDRTSELITSREIGKLEERAIWEVVVAEKDAEHAANAAEFANVIEEKDAEIARLRAELEKRS